MSLTVDVDNRQGIPLSVRLACAPGEMLAITGPSGGGKSTLLATIAGFHRVERGQVACNGRTWLDTGARICLSPQQRRVGMVFQHYALFPHLSVQQNVEIAMLDRSRSERRRRATTLLALTNMEGLESRYPRQLSGGQKQRVAVARALAREPQVLLLDEPFAAVDNQTRLRLYRELASLRQSLNMPMLLVTHDLGEVQQLADSLCLIRHGSVLQSGPVETVMRHPDSVSAARLLGHNNLFDAVVREVDRDSLRVDALGSSLRVGVPALPQDDRRVHTASLAHGCRPGDAVTLLIPPAAVILHRRDRPSRGERENPLHGRVIEATPLGEDISLIVDIDGHLPLQFSVSRHVAARNAVAVGAAVSVSLVQADIHVILAGDAPRSH